MPKNLSLVYVSTDQGTVYDLAAGDVPSSPDERVRLRLALIDVLRRVAEKDESGVGAPEVGTVSPAGG